MSRGVKIGMLFLLACSSVTTTFAQVGIKVEKPEAELDVDGSVRLQKLDNPVSYNRILLADKDGNIGFKDQGDDVFFVKDILYKNLPQTVSSTVYSASLVSTIKPIELGLDILVELLPNSVTAVTIEYNLPITAAILATESVPGYLGITLVKTENGVLTELEEGSRKFTIYDVGSLVNNRKYITMPVSGKATDIIANDSNQKRYITYSAKGYIESGKGITYFGNPLNDTDNFGRGVTVIQVYEKRLK